MKTLRQEESATQGVSGQSKMLSKPLYQKKTNRNYQKYFLGYQCEAVVMISSGFTKDLMGDLKVLIVKKKISNIFMIVSQQGIISLTSPLPLYFVFSLQKEHIHLGLCKEFVFKKAQQLRMDIALVGDWVQFSATISGSLQLLVVPAPADLTHSGLHVHLYVPDAHKPTCT